MPQEPSSAAAAQMIDRDLRPRGIVSAAVLSAMAATPREEFLPAELRDRAYDDCALPIACGQTISQPYIVALMTQSLDLSPEHRVLEIGAGSGYQAAVLSRLAGEVISLERHAELAEQSSTTLARLGYRNVQVIHTDGHHGWPAAAPYDRIILTAATEKVPPPLLDQLANDGLIIAPLGPPETQVLQTLQKQANHLTTTQLTPCRFVPLLPNLPTDPPPADPR